jgi:hypothetical protein
MDEQFAALGPAKHVKSGAPKPQPSLARRSRPSRATLEKAEAAIASTEQRHEEERRVLAEEERKLAARRRTLEQAQRRELADLQAALNAAQRAYDDALEDWRATI